MIQLHLLFPETKSYEPGQEVHHARQDLLLLLTERIKRLPKKLTVAKAKPLIAAIETYVGLGRDLVHLVRFFEGAIALQIRERSRKGDAVVAEMCEAWQVAESTLRLYMRVSRFCNGDIYIFNRYLLSANEYKTQKEITFWCRLMKDKELMPEAAAKEQRRRKIRSAVKDIGEAVAAEDGTEVYVTVGEVGEGGVQLDFTTVSRETILGSTFGSILAWAGKQFGPLTLRGTVGHARKEAQEFLMAVRSGNQNAIVEEAVDMMFLCAQIPGLTAAQADGRDTATPEELMEALIEALREKLEVNRAREWGTPGEDGAVEHVREGVAA